MKKLLKNIFSVIVLVVSILTVLEILKLNILPNKYLTILIVGESVLFLLGLLLYNLKNKFLIFLGILLFLISIIGNIVGYYYLSKMNKYIDNNFAVETYKVTTHYYIVASSNDSINNMDELNNSSKMQYYKYSRSIKKALKILGNNKYNYVPVDKGFEALLDVKNNHSYFLIPNGSYNYLLESTKLLKKEEFKIIYEFDVEEKFIKNNSIKDSYNVYINGLDYTGIMRDFNMIVTVNTKTHKVLLTSIPRDYYIDVPEYNMKDTLMCMGSLDSEVSKEALEKLFDTKIDYTVNVNANSVVQIVDVVGGIDFCSDYEFNTVTDSGKSFRVNKGCEHYDGDHVLGIARHRMTLPGRDRSRQENMRKIFINIVKKLASTTTLTNYTEVLNSFDGLYTTDMNKETITKLIKEGLEDTNFEIIEQSVDGTDGIGIGHLGTQESWIMTPDMNTVNKASKQIKEVLNEK